MCFLNTKPMHFMQPCVESRKQNSLSSAHPHEHPCGFRGVVTALDVSFFIHVWKVAEGLSKVLWPVAFGSCSLFSERGLCGGKCTCLVLLRPWEVRGCCVAQGCEWRSLKPSGYTQLSYFGRGEFLKKASDGSWEGKTVFLTVLFILTQHALRSQRWGSQPQLSDTESHNSCCDPYMNLEKWNLAHRVETAELIAGWLARRGVWCIRSAVVGQEWSGAWLHDSGSFLKWNLGKISLV